MLSEPLLGLLIESLFDESASARAAKLPARFPYLVVCGGDYDVYAGPGDLVLQSRDREGAVPGAFRILRILHASLH